MQPSNDVLKDWEDFSDAEQVSQREVTSSSMSGSQTARTIPLRKNRRVQTETTSCASPTPPRGRSVKGRRQEEPQKAFTDGVRFIMSYAFYVLKGSIEKMRRPLSWFVFLYMFAWMVSRMTSTIRTAFSPMCVTPGISKSMLCVPITPVPSVDFEKLVNVQSSTFEKLVGESAGCLQLSIKVSRAEIATRDLSLLVRYSIDLKSKDDIADILRTISRDTKRTGQGLSELHAKVVGAIDECVILCLSGYREWLRIH